VTSLRRNRWRHFSPGQLFGGSLYAAVVGILRSVNDFG
jgi:hypothetical protein